MPEKLKIKGKILSRNDFLKLSLKVTAAAAVAPLTLQTVACSLTGPSSEKKHAVSIARIKNGNIGYAVEEAIDLLGGIGGVTNGKERIMLKPNLVAESPVLTTKPEIIRALAQPMMSSGKEVLIGEGSSSGERQAAAAGLFSDALLLLPYRLAIIPHAARNILVGRYP